MSDPLGPGHIRTYIATNPATDPPCIGIFVLDGQIQPITFSAPDDVTVVGAMVEWLQAEREKLAKLDATRAYLRSPEAIAERNAKIQATKQAKKERADG